MPPSAFVSATEDEDIIKYIYNSKRVIVCQQFCYEYMSFLKCFRKCFSIAVYCSTCSGVLVSNEGASFALQMMCMLCFAFEIVQIVY